MKIFRREYKIINIKKNKFEKINHLEIYITKKYKISHLYKIIKMKFKFPT